MAVGDTFFGDPISWSDSNSIFAGALAQRQNEALQAALLGDYARQMAMTDYQMQGIPGATERSLGDFMNSMAERGTVWGGSALRGLADVSAGGVGQYMNPLLSGGQATGNWTLGSSKGYEDYGNALNSAMLTGAANNASKYLGMI